MKDLLNENTAKRKKWVLALIIINFLILLGQAVWIYITTLTNKPVDPEAFHINLNPLLLLFAGVSAILAFIELVLGILTYKGKRWAAIALIVCVGICWTGIFGAVAAVLELTYSDKPPQFKDN